MLWFALSPQREIHTPFIENVRAALNQHRPGDPLLDSLHRSVPQWTTLLWQRIDEFYSQEWAGKLFCHLLPHLPHKIFEHFEASYLQNVEGDFAEQTVVLITKLAASPRPTHLRGLSEATIGWKRALCGPFLAEKPATEQVKRLFRESFRAVPPGHLDYGFRKTMGLRLQSSKPDLSRFVTPRPPDLSLEIGREWLRQEPTQWPHVLRLFPFRTPMHSLLWLEQELFQSDQPKRALDLLEFLPPLLRDSSPPYLLQPGEYRRLTVAYDRLFDQLALHQDPALHILFPIFDLLCQGNSETERILKSLSVRRPVARRDVYRRLV